MTPGAQLKQARTAKKLAFADVTHDTRIQAWVLEALEADQLHQQMSPVYAKGFLSQYAKFLGLNPVPLIAELQAALAPPAPAKPELPPPAPAAPLRIKASQVKLPKAETPKLAMPRVQLPKVTLPKVKLPKIEMPRFDFPKVEIPWSRLRRMAPAFAVAAVILAVIAVNPQKQLAKVQWPKMQAPKFAFKMPSFPKPTKLAKVPAVKKLAKAKPEAKGIVVAARPAAKPAAAAVNEQLAKVPALPEPHMTVAPRVASVVPTVQEPKAPLLPALQLVPTQTLELVLITTKATYVQVRVDGKLLAEQRLPRGSKERWIAKRSIDLVVAHPTDVELKLNGQSISPFAVAYRGRMSITHRGVAQLAVASQ